MSDVTLNALLPRCSERPKLLLGGVRIVQGQVANKIAFVAEGFAAFRTFVPLLAGRGRYIIGVVVEVLVATEQLLLPETLVALVTLVGLLIRMNQHV